jgi:hypothetical protein
MFYPEMLSGCYDMDLLDFSTDIPKILSTVQNVVVQNVSNFNKTLEKYEGRIKKEPYWDTGYKTLNWTKNQETLGTRHWTERRPNKPHNTNRNYSAILATLQITSYVHSRNSS